MRFAPLCLVELSLRVLAPITGLPHYPGPHLSAMLRIGMRAAGHTADGLGVIPRDLGITAYAPDEHLRLGLSFPTAATPAVRALLAGFDSLAVGEGHFDPGRTITLEHARCRVSGRDIRTHDPAPLTTAHLAPEIERLAALNAFSLAFTTPLRLPRPRGAKQAGHRYCDEDFFLDPAQRPLEHLIAAVREKSAPRPPCPPPGAQGGSSLRGRPTRRGGAGQGLGGELSITGGGLVWVDIPYGTAPAKTLGGVMGRVRVAGRPDAATAERLVLGQYLGAGKNAAFGLGHYTIPELEGVRAVGPLGRGTTLFGRLAGGDALARALAGLANSSPGPDGLMAGELRAAGEPLLRDLSRRLADGTYAPGGSKRYRLPKPDGGGRAILVGNAVDRLVASAAAAVLGPAVDRLLSDAAWAYRAGLSRQGAARALQAALKDGFTAGVKVDIAAFFDSVDTGILADMLAGLFPGEPLGPAVMAWIKATGDAGLPQGNPLSPLLSNLFLARFDRAMERAGLRLVRYADDCVVLARAGTDPEAILQRVRQALGALKLSLREEKTAAIGPGAPIAFLGYTITAEEIIEQGRDPEEDGDWLPVFEEQVLQGTPVYLTSVCRGACSSGPHLVVKDDTGGTLSVPWNLVSRLVVVGRAPFSGGVVYRALKEAIPVSFIDVMGRLRGHLYPSGWGLPSLGPDQERLIADEARRLALAAEIVSAKIHNGRVLLARNGVADPGLEDLARQALAAPDMETLRGYEGAAAKAYFERFAELVKPLPFDGRAYHPPRGPVNVLLSFGYTLLYNRMSAVLAEKGFEPRLGFFHQGRGTHAALASDLMEELRHVVERVVLALIHLKAIGPGDFTTDARGYARLTGEGFRRFITRWEQTMAATFLTEGRRLSYNARLDEAADAFKRTLKLGVPYKALRIR